MADRSQSNKRRWMVTAARGQTDLEVFVEKLLNRLTPEATDPEATHRVERT